MDDPKYILPRVDTTPFTTMAGRQQAAVKAVMDSIPDEYTYAKNNPQFQESVRRYMVGGPSAVSSEEAQRISTAVQHGILPPNLEWKAWEEIFPTENDRAAFTGQKITAIQAAEQLGQQVGEDMAAKKSGKPKGSLTKQEIQDALDYWSTDPGLRSFKAAAKLTEAGLKELGWDPGDAVRDPEQFINWAKPEDRKKFGDASIGDKYRYLIGTLGGYGDAFMKMVLEMPSKGVVDIFEGGKPAEGTVEKPGQEIARIVTNTLGMLQPVADWVTMLGLDTRNPLGSEGHTQALQRFYDNPLLYASMAKGGVEGAAKKLYDAKFRPEAEILAERAAAAEKARGEAPKPPSDGDGGAPVSAKAPAPAKAPEPTVPETADPVIAAIKEASRQDLEAEFQTLVPGSNPETVKAMTRGDLEYIVSGGRIPKPKPIEVRMSIPPDEGEVIPTPEVKAETAKQIEAVAAAEVPGETGNRAIDLSRQVAHDKSGIEVAQQAIEVATKKGDKETAAKFQADLETRQKRLEESEFELEALKAEMQKSTRSEPVAKDAEIGVFEDPASGAKFEFTTEETPTPGTVPAVKTPSTKVSEVPMTSIKTDVDRFQNRKAQFSEKVADDIHKNYDPNKFDPVVLWIDPKDGGTYVLSGHSRLEGLRRRGETNATARYFEGTEAEAMEFAKIEANRLAAPETVVENISAYKMAVEKGWSKVRLRERFGRDLSLLDALSNLNPKGRFIETLMDPVLKANAKWIELYSRWLGDLRKAYPGKLTDIHEDQVFKWMYIDKEMTRDIPKDNFKKLIEDQVSRFDWDPTQPLQLTKGEIHAVGTRARADTAAAMKKIDDLNALKKEVKTPEEVARIDNEIEILKAKVAEAVRDQTDIFGDQATLEGQPKTMGAGVGMPAPEGGPGPIQRARDILARRGVELQTNLMAGIKRWFVQNIGGDFRERLRAGFEEVGAGAPAGEEVFHTLREKETGMHLTQKTVHKATVAKFGQLLLDEVENLPRRADATERWHEWTKNDLRRDIKTAMRKGDLETMLRIGKQVDSQMFKAAKGIKGIDEAGNPVFGTKQRAGVYDPVELEKEIRRLRTADHNQRMTNPEYDGKYAADADRLVSLQRGEEIKTGEHKGKYQYYREITPEAGQAEFAKLSPQAQEYLLDYVRRTAEKMAEKDIPGIEGYVHSFAQPQTRFKKLWGALRKRTAPERRYRTGILAEEGREIESLILSEKKVESDFEAEAIHNEAAAKLIGTAAIKVPAGEVIPDGYVEVRYTDVNGQLMPRMRQVIEQADRLMEERGQEMSLSEILDDTGHRPRLAVPAIIAEDLNGILEIGKGKTTVTPTTLALLEIADDLAATVVNNVTVTMLIRPKTTGLNFVSGEIQFATKMLLDLNEGLVKGNLSKFKKTATSYVTSLSKTAREGLPAELFGEKWYEQFQKTGTLPGYNELLTAFRGVEVLQKRRMYDAVLRYEAKRIAGGDLTVENALIDTPTVEMLRKAYQQMDLYQFDYANLPKWIDAMKKSTLGRVVAPFPSYMYKGTRLTMHLMNPKAMNVFGKGLSKAERQMRAAHLARAIELGTVGYILTEGMISGDDENYKYDVSGRVPIGTTSDNKRVWLDIKQLPIFREAALGRRLVAGDYDYIAKYADAIYGFGPGVSLLDAMRDVRDVYKRYTPPSSQAGKIIAGLQPYGPILQYLRRLEDPKVRRSYDTQAGFVKNFAYGYLSEMPGFSQMLPEKIDPKTKEPILYKGAEVQTSFWTPFNVKMRDESDATAFYLGQMMGAMETMNRTVKTPEQEKTRKNAERRLKEVEARLKEMEPPRPASPEDIERLKQRFNTGGRLP